MRKQVIKKIKNTNKGFTLLFAVLVSSLVLAVGASIISIATKQVILSGVGRDSQYAFYASNTGIECALYWDLAGANQLPVFATSTGYNLASSGAECVGIDIAENISDGGEYDGVSESTSQMAVTNFRLDFAGGVGPDDEEVPYCVDVSVKKEQDNSAGRLRIKTTILSRGYNTCDETNPRRIERGLELTY